MGAIFLSYAREDAFAAEPLAKGLKASGLDVWWDRRLEGGTEYSSRIERELAECSAVLVLWSAHSIASPWVRDEAAVGRDQGKLVPVSIDGSAPPIGFRQYHTIPIEEWLRAKSARLPSELLGAITAKVTAPAETGSVRAGDEELDRPRLGSTVSPHQEIQFCTAPDGVVLAYSCVGDGPPLVKAANWLNHLEFDWQSPIWRHFLMEFTKDHQVVRYDERGNGLSDRRVDDLSFDAFVSDLETVVDAAGVDRFDLIGISQGAAVGIVYAVRHPERVRRMILVGGYALGWAKRADADERERREAMLTLTRVGWGQQNPAYRQLFTSLYFPDATNEQIDSFNELQRVSASPEEAERLQRALSIIDVQRWLPEVRVPTLVFHSRGDSVVPFEAGRELAAKIPRAHFVTLESNNHVLLEHEPAWQRMVAQTREFLKETSSAHTPVKMR